MRFTLMEYKGNQWELVALFESLALAMWFVDLAKLADPKRLFHVTFNR